MKKISKKSNSEEKAKKIIIDVAEKLFSRYSYLGVSMNDIARRLQITKAALYYHFKSKSELYRKTLDQAFLNLKKSTLKPRSRQDNPKNRLEEVVKTYLDFGKKEKGLTKAFTFDYSKEKAGLVKYVRDTRNRVNKLFMPAVKKVIQGKKTKQKNKTPFLTEMLISMMDGIILEASLLNKRINSNKTAKEIVGILFKEI